MLLLCAPTSGTSLSPTALNTTPTRYDGTDVQVDGFLIFTPQGHVLYDSIETYRLADGLTEKTDISAFERACVTVVIPGSLERQAHGLSKRPVTAFGRFRASYASWDTIAHGCMKKTALFVTKLRAG